MATYKEVNRKINGISQGVDIVTLLIEFEKPQGELRSFEVNIANNNKDYFDEFDDGVIKPVDQKEFFQAYADDVEKKYNP